MTKRAAWLNSDRWREFVRCLYVGMAAFTGGLMTAFLLLVKGLSLPLQITIGGFAGLLVLTSFLFAVGAIKPFKAAVCMSVAAVFWAGWYWTGQAMTYMALPEQCLRFSHACAIDAWNPTLLIGAVGFSVMAGMYWFKQEG